MIKFNTNNMFLAAIWLLPALGFAQNTNETGNTETVLSNPLFITLCGIILLLFMVIYALGNVLIALGKNKQDEKSGNKNLIASILIGGLLFSATNANAQISTPVVADSISGIEAYTFYSLLAIIALELIIVTVLLASIKLMLGQRAEPEKIVDPIKQKEEPTLMDKLNASVSIEKEKDILFDHEYDGIRELDNNLPPWWKYGFYLTIVWGIVYLIYFHVSKTGDLQEGEYKKDVAEAALKLEEFRKRSANMVDESNVTYLTDENSLTKGKELFIANCAACHGNLGEGKVGPNLTDNNWIHGGRISDIFKSLKYGWPDKGMKAWNEDFSPSQLAMISSFVKSLTGTNAPGGKAPEGELYKEETIPADSTIHINLTDSIRTDTTTKNQTSPGIIK